MIQPGGNTCKKIRAADRVEGFPRHREDVEDLDLALSAGRGRQ